MSSYRKKTKHPATGKIEDAMWIDDYFGPHRYGVKFSDDLVYYPDEIQSPEPPEIHDTTISVSGSEVKIQCNSSDEAFALFECLTQKLSW